MIMKDMDKLKHDKANGFYDHDLDMFFNDLTFWLSFKHGLTWSEVFTNRRILQ